jgi:hypothetical protein
LRWNIAWIFWVGYILTAPALHTYAFEYFLLTLTAFTITVLLLTRLVDFHLSRLAVWIVFLVFIVTYYVRFYWIVLDPSPLIPMLPPTSGPSFTNSSALFWSFALTTLFFGVFGLIAWFFLTPSTVEFRLTDEGFQRLYRKLSHFLLLVLPAAMFSLGYLTYRYRIGLLGAQTEVALPYHLAGIVFYSRLILLPELLLTQIWAAERSSQPVIARLGVLLFLLHGISDVFLRASRVGLLTVLVTLVFFAMAGGLRKSTFIDYWLFAVVTACSIMLVPLITLYRTFRLSNQEVAWTLFNVVEPVSSSFWKPLIEGILFITFRIPGIEILTAIIGLDARPLGGEHAMEVLASPRGVAGYLTVNVFGFPPQLPHTNAPSLLGWLYLVGGGFLLVVAAGLLAWFTSCLWERLVRLRLYTRPVAVAMALLLLFQAVTEGTLEHTILPAMIAIFGVTGLEWILRFSCKRTRIL